jgi:uncharacterized protein (DUF2267 family)
MLNRGHWRQRDVSDRDIAGAGPVGLSVFARQRAPLAFGTLDASKLPRRRREVPARYSVVDKKTFFKTVAQRVGCDERRAESLTFAVFQELRDRLTRGEASDVDAQLPAGLKPMWEFLDRPGRHVRKLHEPEFIGEVRLIASLPDEVEAERAVVAVFATLQELLGSPTGMEGEAWDVMSQLPKDLKKLWLGAHKRVVEFQQT